MSTLLTALELKRRGPEAAIVLGGPGLTGKIGGSLLRSFDFLDYIVNGEGERPLVSLIDALAKAPAGQRADVKGVFHLRSDSQAQHEVNQLPDLADLPVPDYTSYF